MLTDRQKIIFLKIVEEFVRTAEPVGSRTISKFEEIDFSSATIRNDMADLEELGYLEKTHSSSGRVPSERGYRYYVEIIMSQKENYENTYPMFDEIFTKKSASRDEAIKESMELVSQLTNYTSIVLGPDSRKSKIKKLQFVALDDRHAVILLVASNGHVESKKILVPNEMEIDEIDKVINVLNEILVDTPVSEIAEKIAYELENDQINQFIKYHEEIVSAFIKAFSKMANDNIFMSGQSKILSLPEFNDVEKVKGLYSAIEEKEIFKIVKASDNGITVRIGHENEIKAMKDCTVVSVPYTLQDGEKGTIAILGPTRMEYSKVIPLLEYIAKNMKKIDDV